MKRRRNASRTTSTTPEIFYARNSRARRSITPSMEKCSTAVSFPDNANLKVQPNVAREILAAAERLPQYDNREFYSVELQTHVLNSVRESCPEAFDEVTNAIKVRLERWPYCALVQGLSF